MLARFAVLALATASIPILTSPSSAIADDDPAQVGEWSAPFDVQVIAIHTTVLPGGKVLLFHRPELAAGSDSRVWDPATGALSDVSFTRSRDIFCAGQTVLSDGRVLVTGGHVQAGGPGAGVKDTDLFDPITETWTAGPSMAEARWYPTNLELGDGSVLIIGGTSSQGVAAQSVELFDPLTDRITTLPPTASRKFVSYPRMHLLPSGLIAKVGEGATTAVFDPASATWSSVGRMKYGQRPFGASVLLPGLTRVLTLGGSNQRGATDAAEIIDFSDPSPAWRFTAPLTHARRHPSAVLLPDGKVLAVGGGIASWYGNPVHQAELFDPASETWSVMAAQVAPRMYHSTAVLLADGRVLSAGQDDKSSFSYTAEIYSPPYLFAGARPMIDEADSSILYGGSLSIGTADADSITRIALVRPAAATHSVDFDQRYVDLSWTVDGQGHITAAAPPDGNQAPPGWYMLFVVNDNGVPSVASWVHVGDTLVPPLPDDKPGGSTEDSTSPESRSGYPVGLPVDGFSPTTATIVTGNEDFSSPTEPGFIIYCSTAKLGYLANT